MDMTLAACAKWLLLIVRDSLDMWKAKALNDTGRYITM